MRASGPGEPPEEKAALRLFPPPAVETTAPVYGDLDFPLPAGGSRPYVVVNMVTSVDGARAVAGKASGIGGEADRLAMRALRARVDAVMVGAGTLRAERLNLGLDDARAKQPLAVIIAGAGPVPSLERLVRNQAQHLLILKPHASRKASRKEPVHSVDGAQTVLVPASGEGRVDLRHCLGLLRRDHGVDRLLVEGGPTLNDSLIQADLVDEYFLTVAPKLLQGRSSLHSSPAQPDPSEVSRTQNLRLLSAHLQNGELFLRYASLE